MEFGAVEKIVFQKNRTHGKVCGNTRISTVSKRTRTVPKFGRAVSLFGRGAAADDDRGRGGLRDDETFFLLPLSFISLLLFFPLFFLVHIVPVPIRLFAMIDRFRNGFSREQYYRRDKITHDNARHCSAQRVPSIGPTALIGPVKSSNVPRPRATAQSTRRGAARSFFLRPRLRSLTSAPVWVPGSPNGTGTRRRSETGECKDRLGARTKIVPRKPFVNFPARAVRLSRFDEREKRKSRNPTHSTDPTRDTAYGRDQCPGSFADVLSAAVEERFPEYYTQKRLQSCYRVVFFPRLKGE